MAKRCQKQLGFTVATPVVHRSLVVCIQYLEACTSIHQHSFTSIPSSTSTHQDSFTSIPSRTSIHASACHAGEALRVTPAV